MTTASPEMLSLARESRGYSQTELARRMGVTQGYVSKLETGIIEIAGDRLEDLAAALRYPVEFFGQRMPFGDSPCLHHRKRQTVRATDLRRIEGECIVAGLVVRNLARGVEIETDNTFPVMDIDEYESPEVVAQITRSHWGIRPGPIRNLVLVIEAAGGVVLRQVFGTRKIDAISQWPPDGGPLFFVNADSSWDRTRYTLAHEIGHLIMHTTPSATMEEEADRFAAEFLMPAVDIAGDLEGLGLAGLEPLKRVWRVSMAALARRAYELDKITYRQYRRLFMQLGRLGYRRQEPSPLDPEEPQVVGDMLSAHQASGLSEEEVARIAKIRVQELRSRYARGGSLQLLEGSA